MGFNAIKFDLDQANDPNKYDRYNWTGVLVNYNGWYDQILQHGKQLDRKLISV